MQTRHNVTIFVGFNNYVSPSMKGNIVLPCILLLLFLPLLPQVVPCLNRNLLSKGLPP